MRIWVARPEPGAARTAARLRERGHLREGDRPASGTLRGRILGTDTLRDDHPGAAFRR